ncbi:MAG: type I restriction enzyme HsdR N-terminal domain-containing protein [Muribaculaceae bacterium]|nr:type I restriction enzyme HsdR N-terminal domain-containing protein [Muribaculaceae bacterium]
MVPLNLPPRQLRLEVDSDGRTCVFDPLRRKLVLLTPEEWVRQHFVAHLVGDLGYPLPLMANEVAVNLNGLRRRCDTVVWNRTDASPLVIVEYKAPSVEITAKVFDQIARYNMVLMAPYLIVSNGLHHFCCRLDPASRTYTFLPSIPPYASIL